MGNSWIYRRSRPSAAFRLFCFPYAGGTAAAYHDWQAAFPDEIEVCAIEPPGRRHRRAEPPVGRLTDLADAVAEAIAGELDLPFAFFGHSLGAVVAFEVSRRLPLGNPQALFLSGAAAPHLAPHRRALANLPVPELIEELRDYGGTPADVLDDPAFAEVFLPVLRADFAVFEGYTPADGPRPSAPVHLYGGDRDARVSPARLWAWRDLVDVASVRLFPGGHFYLRADHRPLTDAIRRELTTGVRATEAA